MTSASQYLITNTCKFQHFLVSGIIQHLAQIIRKQRLWLLPARLLFRSPHLAASFLLVWHIILVILGILSLLLKVF